MSSGIIMDKSKKKKKEDGDVRKDPGGAGGGHWSIYDQDTQYS